MGLESIKNILICAICGFVTISAFILVPTHNRQNPYLKVEVQIQPDTLQFVGKEDVLRHLHKQYSPLLLGQPRAHADLQTIENLLSAHPFAEDVQVYGTHSGFLHIRVRQKRPLARLLYPQGEGAYLMQNKDIIALSERYTARVLLLHMPVSKKEGALWGEREYEDEVFALLTMVNSSPFWRAQVAAIAMSAGGELFLYPQLSKQSIRFGRPTQIAEKLERLFLFYTRVLPYKGWNTYTEVDVRFENQIVCK